MINKEQASKNKSWIILLSVIAVLLLYGIFSYNKLVNQEEKLSTTWNNLQVSYQRRFDMIPQLTQVVKASSDYEKNTLIRLAEIRAQKGGVITTDNSIGQYQDLEQKQADFANTFNKILAVVESYPDIKSQQNYVRLQDQIKGTERRIKFSRKDFNDAVMNYNTYVRTFPSNIAAKIFGFKIKEGFTADMGADKAPEISFNK
ncbi:MAG: LemA family protein [Bacteroidota bacterium]